jgi:hypothetical protein
MDGMDAINGIGRTRKTGIGRVDRQGCFGRWRRGVLFGSLFALVLCVLCVPGALATPVELPEERLNEMMKLPQADRSLNERFTESAAHLARKALELDANDANTVDTLAYAELGLGRVR